MAVEADVVNNRYAARITHWRDATTINPPVRTPVTMGPSADGAIYVPDDEAGVVYITQQNGWVHKATLTSAGPHVVTATPPQFSSSFYVPPGGWIDANSVVVIASGPDTNGPSAYRYDRATLTLQQTISPIPLGGLPSNVVYDAASGIAFVAERSQVGSLAGAVGRFCAD